MSNMLGTYRSGAKKHPFLENYDTLYYSYFLSLCANWSAKGHVQYERDDNKMAPYTLGLVHIVQLNIIKVLKIMWQNVHIPWNSWLDLQMCQKIIWQSFQISTNNRLDVTNASNNHVRKCPQMWQKSMWQNIHISQNSQWDITNVSKNTWPNIPILLNSRLVIIYVSKDHVT
jgi:hypothetical protein